jgi:hypothetical protein
MPDFGSFRGFGEKLVQGQLPVNTGNNGGIIFGFDTDAQDFFNRVTAATGSLSDIEKEAVNNLVIQMKADGTWAPCKAIYPMVGASAAACAQNLKSSSFTGTFVGGWTFASTGVKGNGTSGYMQTGFFPHTQLNVNSNHQSVYNRSNISVSTVDIGQADTKWLTAISFSGTYYIYNPTNTITLTGSAASMLNLSINTRRSSTDFKYFRNNAEIASSSTTNSQSFDTSQVTLASTNGTLYFSPREYAFMSLGDGLTDTQASDLYTAVQAFQTTLGRQV